MPQTKLILKFLPYLLAILLFSFIGVKTYNWVYNKGKAEIQLAWDIEKKQYAKKIGDLQAKLVVKEETHRKETMRIANELSESKRAYEVHLAVANAEYERRLRLSETRASVYQRKAQGGSAERADLASHTAKLDASLEEGRSLVQELGTTLRLRDEQLTAVGQQLLNDRKLFDEPRK